MSLATRLTAFAQAVGADIKSLNGKITYKGDWNAVTVYKKGDQVWYSNDLWLAVTNVSGAGDFPSSDSPSAWRLVTEGMPIGGDPGQILAKYGANAFETEWIDAPSGGSALAAAAYNQGSYSASITPGAAAWQKFLIGSGSGEVIDPVGKYVRNADGSISVVDAGWYSIQASVQANAVSCSCQVSIGDTPNVLGTYALDGDSSSAASFARASTSCTVKLAAGAKIYANGWVSAAAISLTLVAFSIARVGGPKGDKGDTGGNATVPIDPWHLVGAVGEPAFTGGWTNSSGAPPLRFRKDPLGRVWVTGAILPGAGTAFTLPAGYRPVRNEVVDSLQTNGYAGTYVSVGLSGAVTPSVGAGYVGYLDFSFDTETVTQMPTGPKGDTGATGGNATVPIDPWRVVGTAGQPAFQNNWTNYNAGNFSASFRKDPLGRVCIRGVVSNGATGTVIFTLPAGYRPTKAAAMAVPVNSNGSGVGVVIVNPDGTVNAFYSGAAFFSIDDIGFDTDSVVAMPTGPKGDKGDTGNIAGTAVKTFDPWHQVGAAGEPAFLNGWVASDSGGVYYRKDIFGRVYMRGTVNGGATGTSLFQLPVGYRPVLPGLTRVRTISIQNQIGVGQWESQVNVQPDGLVLIYHTAGAGISSVSLDQVEFDSGTVTELNVAITGASQVAIPLEGLHVIGTAGEPAFTNGAGNVSGYTVRYRKDPLGKVSLSGVVSLATGAGDHILFTLPAGYRPVGNDRSFSCPCGGAGTTTVWVNTDGAVHAPKGLTYAYLDSIEFDTETVTTMPAGPQGPKGDPGGVNVLTTLDWDTAITSNFYRSYLPVDFMDFQKTVHGPGDTINPPPQAGIVAAHANGYVVQRVWDLNTHIAWTRHKLYDGSWTLWAADLSKPEVWPDLMVGAATPAEGDERYFQTAAMLAQGCIWKFRYHKVSAKWHFVGGSDYLFTAAAISAAANASATDAALSFPAILPGSYDVEWGARMYQNPSGPASGNVLLYLDQMRGASTISSVGMDIWTGQLSSQTWSTVIPGFKSARVTAVVNGDAIRLRSSSTNYNGALESPFMRIRPVSVSM